MFRYFSARAIELFFQENLLGSVSGRVNVHTGHKDHTDVMLKGYLRDASWNEIFAVNATAELQLSAPANGTCSISAQVDTPIVDVTGHVDFADQWYSVQANGAGVEFAQIFTIPSIVPNLCTFPPVTAAPTVAPTQKPIVAPSVNPSVAPSLNPSASPTAPSVKPTLNPSRAPNAPLEPSPPPTKTPTRTPSQMPSANPSIVPSKAPSREPTTKPTVSPSNVPSFVPSASPSRNPSMVPTRAPTIRPTSNPSTGKNSVHFAFHLRLLTVLCYFFIIQPRRHSTEMRLW